MIWNRAVEAALRENLPDLLSYIERRVEPRADAADALSATIEVIWRKARHLPSEPEQARMWMFGIARNSVRNTNRARVRRDAAVERLRNHIELTTAPSETEESDQIRAAISNLPRQLQELVRLIHWDGFSLVDAAAITGISSSTARSRYARARELLRSQLNPPILEVHATSIASGQ